MRRRAATLRLLAAGALSLWTQGCGIPPPADPEGALCDPGGVCPPGYLCADNLCRTPASICAELPCNTPPAPRCTDASTLRTFGQTGACVPETRSCSYRWAERTCEQGCLEGACVGEDPCAALSCEAPPATTCTDAMTLTTYAPLGVCTGGRCQYAATSTACAQGCRDGACVEEPCLGVRCEDPPAPACSDATTLTTYAQSGTCSGGTCRYAPTTTPCPHGCAGGACVSDRCAGVTCDQVPESTCSGLTLTTYGAGTCDSSTGGCTYAPTTRTCDFNCVAGACVSAPRSFARTAPHLDASIFAIDLGPTSSGNVALAVGANGFVARWDGTSWTQLPSGVSGALYDVWLATDTVGYIVGANGVILKYQNGTLTKLASGTSSTLISVHGAGQYVIAINARGSFVSSPTGTTFTYREGPSALVASSGVFVDSNDGSVRIAGRCSSSTSSSYSACVAYRGSSGWLIDRFFTASYGYAVGPSLAPGVAYFATSSGIVRHHGSTGSFDTQNLPAGIAGSRVLNITSDRAAAPNLYFLLEATTTLPAELYRHSAAAGTTRLHRLRGDQWSMSRNYSGGLAVVEGTSARSNIFRRTDSASEALELADFDYVAADGLGTRRVAINALGDLALAEPGKSTVSFWHGPAATQSVNGVVLATTYALLFGDGGTYSRWTEASGHGAASTHPGTGDLLAGCRNSDTEVYLVGAQGRIFRYDGAALTPMPSGTTTTLRAVACTGAGGAFAVGDAGVVLRLAQGSWSAVTPSLGAPSALTTAWASDGALYVGGDGFFARYAGSGWTQLPSLPKLGALAGVSASELYGASDNHVVRFNGASWNTVFTGAAPLSASTVAAGTVSFVGAGGLVLEGR